MSLPPRRLAIHPERGQTNSASRAQKGYRSERPKNARLDTSQFLAGPEKGCERATLAGFHGLRKLAETEVRPIRSRSAGLSWLFSSVSVSIGTKNSWA